MKMIRVLSALSLVAAAPCVVSGQNPTPAPSAPVERRVEAHTMKAAPAAAMRSMRMSMPAMHPMMMKDAASMFLAHTGDLQLTDAQVTRLAAIARRAEAREKAIRTRMDSSMATMHERVEAPQDGMPAARTMVMKMMRGPMPTEAERKAQHEDNREAFAVPTPDQLATLWEMMMMHHGR